MAQRGNDAAHTFIVGDAVTKSMVNMCQAPCGPCEESTEDSNDDCHDADDEVDAVVE